MLLELKDAVRLLDDAVAVIVTVPVKPPRLARLRAEVPLEPEVRATVVGLALMLKSGTFTVTVTVCERLPKVAVIVTV